MKALQIILITLTALSGCKKNLAGASTTKTTITSDTSTMNSGKNLTYLALGDSYTIGESVDQDQSYPYQLIYSLNINNSIMVSPPKIIAITGWTTDNLINAIAQSGINNQKFNFVTLLIGVNDQFQGSSQDNYKIKFAEVLNTAISFANGDVNKVFVISIPDYGATPFGKDRQIEISPEIDQFNAINKAASLKAGVTYVNITDISRLATKEPDLVAPDGLHPSGDMYKLWIQLLEPLVAAKLKK